MAKFERIPTSLTASAQLPGVSVKLRNVQEVLMADDAFKGRPIMRQISIANSAMTVGMVFAGCHAAWATLVGVGWATKALNIILALHFLELDFRVAPYSALTALLLIAATFCVGAILGGVFALVWNSFTTGREPLSAREPTQTTAIN